MGQEKAIASTPSYLNSSAHGAHTHNNMCNIPGRTGWGIPSSIHVHLRHSAITVHLDPLHLVALSGR